LARPGRENQRGGGVMEKMTAHDINVALAKKHTEDFFITEVKNGPTWFVDELLRMDAVAIKKSWTKPCVTIYEVKVDRQDFLRDSKWPQYIEYCHRFYFACPKDLIKPEDIPDPRVGLIWVYENGNIRTVKPVPMRPIEIPSWFFQYIVFSKIDSDRIPFYSKKEEYIQAFIDHKISCRELSNHVKSALITKLSELEEELQRLQGLKNRLEEYEEIQKVFRTRNLFWNTIENLSSLLDDAEKYQRSIREIEAFKYAAEKVAKIEVK
jgi:hypothetical protein